MYKIRTLDLFVALYVFGTLCAEVMGSKTFPLFTIAGIPLHASVAVFLIPLLFTLPDAIVEVYGRARAQSMVLSGFLTIVLLVLFSSLATHLPATQQFAASEPAYERIFSYSVRIALASLTAFGVSELLDVLIFSWLRQLMQRRALWLRNITSNITSEFADSAVFLTLAFYSFEHSVVANMLFLLGLLLPYWSLKCLISVAETPLVYAAVWWLRKDSRLEIGKKGRA